MIQLLKYSDYKIGKFIKDKRKSKYSKFATKNYYNCIIYQVWYVCEFFIIKMYDKKIEFMV